MTGRVAAIFALRRRADRSDDVRGALEILCAELRAGAPPGAALLAASDAAPGLLDRGALAAAWGADVANGLRSDAAAAERTGSRSRRRTPRPPRAISNPRRTVRRSDRPSAEAARAVQELADIWDRSVSGGTGLADAADGLRLTLADNAQIRQELSGHLAAPRATGFALAMLPLLGIALGEALGAGSLTWLANSAPGRLLVLAAIALDLAGLAWTAGIARRIESQL